MIHLFQPQLGDAEISAMADVVHSRWIGHGPRTAAFEAAFASHLGVDPDRVLFLASGTASLFLAVELLELEPGDEIVMPAVSFVAAANAAVARGARPVFCDVDERTLNPSLEQLAAVVTPRTKAVIILHYGGYPGDVAAIAGFCRDRGITLIEDAACSVASSVHGQPCGTFGDLAIWSFDAMKVLTTGDGGMLYVRDKQLALRARRLAYHGLRHLSGLSGSRVSRQWWKLDLKEPGRRIIGNDLTAAVGLVQLERLPQIVARRKEIAELYDRELADAPGLRVPPPLPAGHQSSYYFYWLQFSGDIRDAVAADLLAADIYTTFRYEPLHHVALFGHTGALAATDRLARSTLCVPLHPGLSDADVHTVVAQVRKAVEANS
jgi:aminotransferase